jgi:hypothetical protein
VGQNQTARFDLGHLTSLICSPSRTRMISRPGARSRQHDAEQDDLGRRNRRRRQSLTGLAEGGGRPAPLAFAPPSEQVSFFLVFRGTAENCLMIVTVVCERESSTDRRLRLLGHSLSK